MNCKNIYCPIKYEPDKEPCISCKHNPGLKDFDLPPGFADIFGLNK